MAGHVTSGSRSIGVAGSVEKNISSRPVSMICGYNSVLILQSTGVVAVRNNYISQNMWRQTHGIQLVGGDCHDEGCSVTSLWLVLVYCFGPLKGVSTMITDRDVYD